MIITSAKWADEGHVQVAATTSDEGVLVFNYYETYNSNETYHMGNLRTWIANGGTISAWTDPVDYMAKMRAERDTRLAEIDWRIIRNYTQVEHSETPTDDGTKMAAIYQYQKDLRDFPANNPITTKAQYDALVWPTKPA
jgi:hypothetical protein